MSSNAPACGGPISSLWLDAKMIKKSPPTGRALNAHSNGKRPPT
jgi:hypothetical protein